MEKFGLTFSLRVSCNVSIFDSCEDSHSIEWQELYDSGLSTKSDIDNLWNRRDN